MIISNGLYKNECWFYVINHVSSSEIIIKQWFHHLIVNIYNMQNGVANSYPMGQLSSLNFIHFCILINEANFKVFILSIRMVDCWMWVVSYQLIVHLWQNHNTMILSSYTKYLYHAHHGIISISCVSNQFFHTLLK